MASRDIPQIIIRLYACHIISDSEFERISQQRSDSEKMQRIVLYSVMPGTRDQFNDFIEILSESNPGSVRTIRQYEANLTEGSIIHSCL